MLEKHHIIFKSQGGLDFPLNYKYLTADEHRGDFGPHKFKATDLSYKRTMELELRVCLYREYYAVEELVEKLKLRPKQAQKAFKRVAKTAQGISREDVIRRLMGGRMYLGGD